jgi:hypothetical protein
MTNELLPVGTCVEFYDESDERVQGVISEHDMAGFGGPRYVVFNQRTEENETVYPLNIANILPE